MVDPASIGTGARIASAVVRPIIARLFAKEADGAGLVEKPVKVTGLLKWRGEKRLLNRVDMWTIARDLVNREIEANPIEPPVHSVEREAVTDALAATLAALGELDLEDVEAVRLGHRELARRMKAARPNATRDLSADATLLHDNLLDLSCLHILHFFTQRSTFVARTLLEQTRLLDEMLRRLDSLVGAMPRTDSSGGKGAAFEARYLAHLVKKHGKLNIFGLDLSNSDGSYWPLDTAYLSLELVPQKAGGAPTAKRKRVEDALAGCNRVLLRGLAGSGKTTLMQWLAVSAAQHSLPDELAGLHGRIPFVLPLRTLAQGAALPRPEEFLAAVGNHLHGVQPEGWADEVLLSGRGMLLIDGVDEVSEGERPLIRRWLLELVAGYPQTFFIVTTRPSAVGMGWLTEEEFQPFDLLPMNRNDVDRFLDRWHDAVLGMVKDPEERQRVERCRSVLRDTLRRKHDLYRLATNPLMCAMLCALHRDRQSHLPERRMELYAAALSMLLVRRDKERDIPAPAGLVPSEEALVQLLQRIAYWLIRNGRSEASQGVVIGIIRERLPAMPQMAPAEAAKDVFRYLLLRSGLLREPSANAVDFIHRTFQDYLGAKAAVESADLDLLAEHGGDDQWEDVIRLAVGHARDSERAYLLRRLVEIGDSVTDERARRRHHLLAAAALEHATTLDPAIRQAVTRRTSALIPPTNAPDAEDLATAGDMVFALLPPPESMSTAEAMATLLTIAMIGGEGARHRLAAYRRLPDPQIRQQLLRTWANFDARSFAEEILVGLPLDDVVLECSSQEQLDCLDLLGPVPHVMLHSWLLGPGTLDKLAAAGVHSLHIAGTSLHLLPPLGELTSLRKLTVDARQVPSDGGMLADSRIADLTLTQVSPHTRLGFLGEARRLRTLALQCDQTIALPEDPLPGVEALSLDGDLPEDGLPDIAAAFPGLVTLTLRLACGGGQQRVDLSPLAGFGSTRVDVTLVQAGRVTGTEGLPADRVTVRYEGRARPGLLGRFRS